MGLLKRVFRDEAGEAAVSVAIIHFVNTLGSQLKSTFTTISSQLATAGK
jgi:Flp pilus assembly pilin Flp